MGVFYHNEDTVSGRTCFFFFFFFDTVHLLASSCWFIHPDITGATLSVIYSLWVPFVVSTLPDIRQNCQLVAQFPFSESEPKSVSLVEWAWKVVTGQTMSWNLLQSSVKSRELQILCRFIYCHKTEIGYAFIRLKRIFVSILFIILLFVNIMHCFTFSQSNLFFNSLYPESYPFTPFSSSFLYSLLLLLPSFGD